MRIGTFLLILVLSIAPVFAVDLPAEIPAGEIAGTITDESGAPIEGALVDAWTWYTGNETKTDNDGHFHLKKLDPRHKIELRISKDGFSPWYNHLQPTGEPALNVALNNKTYLQGVVTSPDGAPVPNALVRAASSGKQADGVFIGEVWTETKTDAEGKYRMYVAPDSYDVMVRVPGVGAARMPQAMRQGDTPTLDIALEKGATFISNIVDSVTGEAVPGVKLSNWQHKGIEGTSDEKGVLTIDGMQVGKFEFEVTHKGYARWWSDSAIEADQQKPSDRSFDDLAFMIDKDMAPVAIVVEKAVTITGTVVDPDGKPVNGATVAPAKTGTGNSLTGDTRFSVRSKSDGSFTMILPASNGKDHNLVAHDGPYEKTRKWANGVGEPFQSKPGDKVENVTLTLTKGATVKGRVVDASGEPAADKEVRAVSTDGLDNRYYVPSTRTDKDGNYELKFVRPAEMMIQVEPFWLSAGEAPGESTQTVTFQAGETQEIGDLKTKPVDNGPRFNFRPK
jgi:hypothetical protein